MFPIDFCHIPVSIIKRSAGRSAVAAAAYRSGTKLTNEWDGMTHDYTRKGGIVHAEIMLPAHAPPEFADRSILWNSVEQIEKARDSQLAREIEAALPRELSGEEQLALVRAYVKDNFVDKGMCADFAIHDKGTGNPHVHIMLTLRPLKENGQWGAKCRKAYDLDENGQRIPDGKGGWKNHREDTTDWNDKGNVEIWRAAWAACTNRALEAAGHPALVDHRSYKRQGIDKIPYTAQMIATITRQQIGTVERALQIFLKLGLVEVLDSGTFYMSNIELLIGQSSTEAERKRAARLQNKALSAPRTNGGHLSDIRPPEIEIELEKEIEIKREIEKGRSARAYGRYQNVFLTDEELADLQASFPTVWGQYIEKLSEYMASTGKRYQSHAATIRRWAGEDAKKAAPPTRNRDYSVKEDETV